MPSSLLTFFLQENDLEDTYLFLRGLRENSMADNQISKVTADLKRNRLLITVSAVASPKEAQKIYTDIRFCVADLRPGFDVITDFSQCTLAHLSVISTMRQIMEYLVTKQPGTVIRVVGKNSLLFKQMLQFLNKFQSYKPIYVNTREEAEEILSKLTQRKGLRYNIFGHRVDYTVGEEKGTGKLADISTSGCAIQGLTIALSTGQEASVVIPIDHGDNLPPSFTFAARIVRVEDDHFAVQFFDLNDDQKAHLHQWFTYEIRQEKPHAE